MKTTCICIIPSRSNSKRLKNKNFLKIGGKYVVNYTIESAIQSKIFSKIILSGDCKLAEDIANQNNIDYSNRPKHLRGDYVSSTDVCLDIIQALEDKDNYFDFCFCLQPSSPIRDHKDIKKSLNKIKLTKSNYLVSVSKIDPHYFHWALKTENKVNYRMYFKDKYMKERLLLPTVYRPNGSIKVAKVKELKKRKNFFGSKTTALLLSPEKSIHIADRFDYIMAKSFLEL